MNLTDEFIKLEGVTRSFNSSAGRFDALKDIDLVINRGEYTAIIGKSGSGKSTMLNMLTGIDHPSKGTVTIDGTLVHTMNESGLSYWRGKNIGIVFQFFQLIPTLTVGENILLAMDFVDVIPRKERKERTMELLSLSGIPEHAKKLPSLLSGGEQQRAAIARALANDPPVIAADEPTGNLDSKTTEIIFGLFSRLVKAGKTVIVVTHEKSLHRDYDRIITLNDGMIAGDERADGSKKGGYV